MLLEIREKAQGWIAWLIVAFISIPFALWGIQSYLGVGEEPVAATVDGEEITQREVDRQVRLLRDRLRVELGGAYRPELFPEAALRRQVLEQLINQEVLQRAADAWNLRAGDELVRAAIRSIPAFQRNGRFDVEAYNIAVRNQGLSQRAFEESIRLELVLDQLQRGVTDSAIATDLEVNEYIRLRDQKRRVSWLRMDGRRLIADYTPTDEELKAYYDEHKARWRIPERVKVEYLLLDPETVGAEVEVTEEALKDYWAQHKDEFQVPEERKVRHILVALPENADAEQETQARARADAIVERLKAGEDFSDLARELSDDPGSREQGGELGWLSEGMMPKTFEAVAFALDEGEVSRPVRTPFGFHVVQVTGIKSGGEGDFESLRHRVEAAYRRHRAEERLFDKAEQLADLAYEHPDELETAAEALGLEIRRSDWFDRNGGEGPLASPKVAAAAFSQDVLEEGHNSELIELDEDQVLVLRVVEHEMEQVPPFEAVEAEVRKALLADKAAERARERGESLVARLAAGELDLDRAAQESGSKVISPGMIGRRSTEAPMPVVEKAFALPRPAEGHVSVGGVELPGGDYAVLVVSGVEDGDPSALDDEARRNEARNLARAKGQAQFGFLVRDLRAAAEVEVTAE